MTRRALNDRDVPTIELVAPDRRGTDCNKWRRYAEDVLPLWVADMDFAADPAIIDAVRERLSHPVLGYGSAQDTLRETLVATLKAEYGWRVEPDWLLFLPGVEPGFNMALNAFTRPGDRLLEELPVYRPLRVAADNWKLQLEAVWQAPGEDGRWHTDRDALAAAAARCSAYILCNPQNPTGRVYTRGELEARAELCLRHDLTLISDEIHCGLTLDGRRHVPIASLSPEIAQRSVTLMAASKTWNIAGLKAAFAIVPDPARRRAMESAKLGMVDSVNVLGLVAMEAAYGQAEAWRQTVRRELAGNRDLVTRRLARDFPAARVIPAEASFLAWIDFTACGLPQPAAPFFLEHARVAMSAGEEFGPGLEHWARLNFGCAAATLETALDRMANAMRPGGHR